MRHIDVPNTLGATALGANALGANALGTTALTAPKACISTLSPKQQEPDADSGTGAARGRSVQRSGVRPDPHQ